MASSKNLQCEWSWLLLRAKQQVSMSLDMDNVNNVEMFKNGLVKAAGQVWGNCSHQSCGKKKTQGQDDSKE